MQDLLSLLSELQMAEMLYLDFHPENLEGALHQYEKIAVDLQRKTKLTAREKQIAALAFAAQAVIWAHWLYKDANKDSKIQHVNENCGKALGLAGDTADVRAVTHLALGIMHQNRGQYHLALHEFTQAVEADRFYPAALIRQAITWALLAGLHKYSPSDTPGHAAISAYEAFNITEVERRLGEVLQMVAKAEPLLQETIDKRLHGAAYGQRQWIDMKGNLARLYTKTGHLQEGIEAYEQVIAMDPQNYNAWDNIAYRIDESNTDSPVMLRKAKRAAERGLQLAQNTKDEAKLRKLLERVEEKLQTLNQSK